MVRIDEEDNRVIHLTRGDVTTGSINRLAFRYEIHNFGTGENEYYHFKLDDKISFIVSNKSGYPRQELFRVEYTPRELGYVEGESPTTLEIPLTEELTKKFPLLSKRKTYWYDIVLNDTITMAGLTHEGACKIIVYPEGGELGE